MASNSAGGAELDLTKASTEAATSFVDAFYSALANSRDTISTYYMPAAAQPDGTMLPSVTWNGNIISDGTAVQKLFKDDMPAHLHYDLHAVDAQVLNPKFAADGSLRSHRNFSMLVTTNGHLRLDDRKTGPLKDFSETFVLVPNVVAGAAKGGPRKRDWVIQMQNFRYTVNHQGRDVAGQVAMEME